MSEFREIRTGIYFLCKDRQVVYVGQSLDVSRRLKEHEWDQKDFDSVLLMSVPEQILNEVEQYWIERIEPRLNTGYKLEFSTEEAETNLKEWGDAERIRRIFGISNGTLKKLANAERIKSRFIKSKGIKSKAVRFFNIQSVRDFMEANVVSS